MRHAKEHGPDYWLANGRVNDWVFYIGKWWQIVKKYDWIWRNNRPTFILRRNYKMVYYLGVHRWQ